MQEACEFHLLEVLLNTKQKDNVWKKMQNTQEFTLKRADNRQIILLQ